MDERKNVSPYLLREIAISRLRDILLFIPVMFGVLFLAPIIDFSAPDALWFGIPAKIALVFLLWLVVILGVKRTSRKMLEKLNER